MKRWYVGVLAVLLIALSTTVFAYGPRGGHMGLGIGGPCFATLNLSKEQADKMWQLKEKFRNDTQALRRELFQKRFDLRALYGDPKADETALITRQKEVNELRAKLADKMAQFKIEQRKILTPEQIQKLNEMPYGRGFGPCGAAGKGFGGKGYRPRTY